MAIRTDINIRWDLSPRLIIIDASSLQIGMQDLIDTLRSLEAEADAMDEPFILNASGKESLGGGVTVGLTVELQNAKIYFEQRSWTDASGTATSADLLGQTLTDSTADFITDSIEYGNIAFNVTTGAMATILDISTNALTTLTLTGGNPRDTWEVGDLYHIYPNELCVTAGGNLVAVDELGADLYPILQSPNVQSTLTSSSSATSQNLEALQYSSFQNGVWVDINGVNGTVYPKGTPITPVNNMSDAQSIAELNGFNNFNFLSDWSFSNLTLTEDYRFNGFGPQRTTLTFDNTCYFPNLITDFATITGEVKGIVGIENCLVSDLTFLDSSVYMRDILFNKSLLDGSIVIPNDLTGTVKVLDSWSNIPGNQTPQFMWNDASADLFMRNYSGGIALSDYSQATNRASIDLNAGQVQLKDTVTAGFITTRGVGYITDDSSGATVNVSGLMSKATVADAVLATSLEGYTEDLTVASSLQISSYTDAQVWVDAIDGSVGIIYPYGSQEIPVNTVEQAVIIATELGFSAIRIKGDYTFDTSILTPGLTFIGDGNTVSDFTFNTKMLIPSVSLQDAKVTGWLSGINLIDSCHIIDFGSDTFITSTTEIQVIDSLIEGTITLPNTFAGKFQVLNCWAMPDIAQNPPILDHGGCSGDIQIRNLSGFITVRDVSVDVDFRVFLNSGGITLNDTVVNGDFIFTGIGNLVNNSDPSAKVNSKGLVSGLVIDNTAYAVEALRPHHTGFGKTVYWDSFGGNDLYDGSAESLAVKTFSRAHDLATDGGHDTIIALATDTGQTVVDEHLTISKNYTFVRGPGRDLKILPIDASGPTISITGVGVEISGFIADTSTGGISNAVDVSTGADFFLIENFWSNYSSGMAIYVSGDVVYGRINNSFISHSGGHGIHLNGNVRHTKITNTEIDDAGSDGILIEGTTASNNIIGDGTVIYNSGEYGMRINAPSLRTLIKRGLSVFDNSSGNLLDNGTETQYEEEVVQLATASAVWDTSVSSHLISGTTGRTIGDALYNGVVTINSTTGTSGTTFPIGTKSNPVDNLTDAKIIATAQGTNILNFTSDFILNPPDNISGYVLQSAIASTIEILPGVATFFTNFKSINVKGDLLGYTIFADAIVDASGVREFYGIMDRTVFNGDVSISTNTANNAIFLDCFTGNVQGPPDIDCGGDGAKISFRGLTGAAKFVNKTGSTQKIFLDIYSARVGFDSTVTDASIAIRGVGYVYLNDASTTGVTFDTTGLMSKGTVADAVLDTDLTPYSTDFTVATALQLSAYNNAVWVDAIDGSVGTDYPYGTQEVPVNTIEQAIDLAVGLGFDNLRIQGDYNFDSSISVPGFTISGDHYTTSTFTFDPYFVIASASFRRANLQGWLSGASTIEDCQISDIGSDLLVPATQTISVLNTLISGEIIFPPTFSGDVNIFDCWSTRDPSSNRASIDFGDSSMNLNIRNFAGAMVIRNCTQSSSRNGIALNVGSVELESSVTAGSFNIGGIGFLFDYSGASTNINSDALISKDIIAEAVWDTQLSDHILAGTTGKTLGLLEFGNEVRLDTSTGTAGTTFPIGTRSSPVNNIADAKTIAIANNLSIFHIHGDVSLNSDFTDYIFVSDSHVHGSVNLGSNTITDALFKNITILGDCSGNITAEACTFEDVTNLQGRTRYCNFKGNMTIAAGKDFTNTYAGGPEEGTGYYFDLNGTGTATFLDSQGIINISNMTDPGSVCAATGNYIFNLDATVTAGTCFAVGTGVLNNNSTSLTALIDYTVPATVWDQNISTKTDASTAGYSLWNNAKQTVNKILPFLFTD